MALQIEMLAALCETQDCVTVAALADLTSEPRKEVAKTCGKLVERGLIERVRVGCYRASPSGRQAFASGLIIKPGPKGKLTAPARRPNTLRARLWRALRAQRKASIPDLLGLAATGCERDAENNAQGYLRALERAGFVREMSIKQPGAAMTSNGHIRWLILRDTGPKAPMVNMKNKTVRDANDGQIYSSAGVE